MSKSLIGNDIAPVPKPKVCNVCQGSFGAGEGCQMCGSNWYRVVDARKGLSRLRIRIKSGDTLIPIGDPFKKLPRETKRSLKKLQEYHISPGVTTRLRRKFPFDRMSNQEISICIAEFKKFVAVLIIGRAEKKKVAMTNEIIDQVWHEFILFTKDYIEFSFAVRRDYIHHSPNTGDDKFGPEAARYFHETYAKYFGKIHPVWKLKVRESKVIYDPKTDTYCSIVSSSPVDKSAIASYTGIKNELQSQPTLFFDNISDGGDASFKDGQNLNTADNASGSGDGSAANFAEGSNPILFTRYEITNQEMSSLSGCGNNSDGGCGGSCRAGGDDSGCGDGCSACSGCGGCG